MDLSECSTEFFDKISDITNNDIADINIVDNNINYNRKKIITIYKHLKAFYKVLLSNESRHFSTLLAGISYINDKYGLEPELEEKYYGLAGLYRVLYANPKLIASTDEYNFALKYALLIVQKISSYDLPEHFRQYIKNLPDIQLKKRYNIDREKTDIFRAIVVENPFYRKKINAPYIEISCRHDDIGNFTLKIGYPYLENANMIFAGMCINLLSAEIIRNEPYTLSIHSPGIFVFEPDYMIDATDLAESYGLAAGYKIYFLKRYFSAGVSYPMVLGNLINSLFDELLLNPEIEFEQAKLNAFQNKPLSLFALFSKGQLKNGVINQEMKQYFGKIQNVVENVLKVNFEDAIYSVESSFISPTYGIQGRLDLLAEYTNDPLRKDIIELKSGSSPAISYGINVGEKKVPIGVWVNHLAQVIAYNLLLDSTFPNRKGSSSILYIKTEDNPLRDVANLPNVIERMVLHRNNIILLENSVMNRSYKFFEIIDQISQIGIPPYISDKVNLFHTIFQSLNVTERAYLLEFTSYILRESYAVKTGASLDNGNSGYSSLWNDSLEDKLESNNILAELKLNIAESDFENLHLVFDINQKDIFTSFRKGDIAILFSYQEGIDDNKISNQLLKCNLKSISSEKITVSLRNKLVSRSLFNSELLWRLEPDSIDSIDKISYSSVFNFLSDSQHKRDLLFGKSEPQFSDLDFNNIDGLNENQNEIVKRAVNAKDYFLIQGPPGTGKTNVILKNIAKEILNSTSGNILITAYTNRAVDELSSSLSSLEITSNFIRIGSKDASDDVERHLPSIIEKYGMKFAYEKLKQVRIIISTVASILTNQEIFDIKQFDTLIVDEASQILEPQIIGLIAKCGRFILIGDEKQLPPVVVQSQFGRICENELLNEIGIINFSDSLFERLIRTCKMNNWFSAFGQLEYQARMHIEIQDFPSKYFYANSLKPTFENQSSLVSEFNIDSENNIEKMLASGRMIFIDCPAEKGKINKTEAESALKIIDYLSHKIELNPDNVGVISPFRMQCFEIHKRLSDEQKKFISVDTVERYQGSQRDFIILTMATGNKSLLERAISKDASGTTDRKLNVAITRAKSHFILLGNSYILSESQHYSELIKFIHQRNSVYSYKDL